MKLCHCIVGQLYDNFLLLTLLKFPDMTKTATPSSMGGTNSRMTTSSQIEQTVPHYLDLMMNMFAIAYIWAFGGHLHDR